MHHQLTSVEELAAVLEDGRAPRILDVRWRLGATDGESRFLEGHIPGAVYVDLDRELAGHGAATDGRHPLPAVRDLESAARSWGLGDGDAVVVYDDNAGQSAARAWWLLRYAGVADVRVLDGGLAAWRAAGHALEEGAATPRSGSVNLTYGHLPVLDMDEAAALPATGVLLDARAPERFRGEVEPVDPVAGHIPGALNAPSSANLAADGRFLPAAELRRRYEELGVSADAAVGVYCGSGVTAAHDALALAVAGFEAALYPGSWSQWSNHPDRPVETSPEH
ncbi:sulfurtransferase [Rathayibacter sp. YIM 133350]|uniref:sulfurtransferase n=1 Tax=Rathayibacter sp. YIM 133350 TaxID=3131992 RepID=UPI00307E01D7